MLDDARPIFQQIAERLEDDILDESLAEEDQVPSTNELAAFHRINPGTAARGMSELVSDGTIYKRRGIGMFVSTGARDKLLTRRREDFVRAYVTPLIEQARRLEIDGDDLVAMIRRQAGER